MDLTNLLTDFSSLLLTYIDELRNYFRIERTQDIEIFEIKQSDNNYHVTIRFKSQQLIPLLNNIKRDFEHQLLRLLYSLRKYYNFKHIKINLDNEYIELRFQLDPYPSTLLNLPDEIIRKTFITSSVNEIENLCLADEEIKEKVCDSNIFWYEKLVNDFGDKFPYTEKAREMYQNHGKLYTFRAIFNQPKLMSNDIKFKLIALKEYESLFVDYDDNLWIYNYEFVYMQPKLLYELIDIMQYPVIGEMMKEKYGSDNQIIYPKIKAIACTKSYPFILDDDGLIWALTKSYKILINDKFLGKSISSAEDYLLIIDNNGRLWAVLTFYAQIIVRLFDNDVYLEARPTHLNLPFKVKEASGDHSRILVISDDDEVWLLKINRTNVNPRKLGLKAKKVVCYGHCMIIDQNDDLWSFGDNLFGQLGLGHSIDMDNPVKVDLNFKVKNVECGIGYTILLDQDNNMWACGHNKKSEIVGFSRIRLTETSYNTFQLIPFDHKIDLIAAGNDTIAITVLY